MKKLLMTAIATALTASTLSAETQYAGSWRLVSENGKPQTGYSKEYLDNGEFSVYYEIENHGKVRTFQEQQRGKWSLSGNDVISEDCLLGDKGTVKLISAIEADTLIQTFAYPTAPTKVYTQKFVRYHSPISEISAKTAKPISAGYYLRGLGTFGGDFSKTVFIIDGTRATLDDVKALDGSAIEQFSALKDSSINNYLTPEEIASGVNRVIIITLNH